MMMKWKWYTMLLAVAVIFAVYAGAYVRQSNFFSVKAAT